MWADIMNNETFGGYLPLELPTPVAHYYPAAKCYMSARTALCHFLTTFRPERMWLPHLICHSVIDAVRLANVEIVWYHLDDKFFAILPPELNEKEYIFYVDYLGQGVLQKNELLRRYPKGQIIFDNSQAFYAPPLPVLATLYSPRKFFGLPDGGLLITSLPLPPPELHDSASLNRVSHLLLQHNFDIREGYSAFQQAELTLENTPVSGMSQLSERLLLSIDYFSIKQKRERNFKLLHERLKGINSFPLNLDSPQGPLCYPLYFPARSLHSVLIKNGVFVPTYWKEVLQHVPAESVEAKFVKYMVAIPCDQRYSQGDIERLSKVIMKVVTDDSIEINK